VTSRIPLRLALERLTAALTQAVLDTVRNATLAELVAPVATTRGAVVRTPKTRPSLRVTPAAVRAGDPDRPRRAPRAKWSADATAEPVMSRVETAAASGTEIDAVAIFAALERQTTAAEERASEAPTATDAPCVAAASAGAEPSARTPVLRPGEEVLRTATGGVVLRRRRAESRG
jgi:hypothetical protein